MARLREYVMANGHPQAAVEYLTDSYVGEWEHTCTFLWVSGSAHVRFCGERQHTCMLWVSGSTPVSGGVAAGLYVVGEWQHTCTLWQCTCTLRQCTHVYCLLGTRGQPFP